MPPDRPQAEDRVFVFVSGEADAVGGRGAGSRAGLRAEMLVEEIGGKVEVPRWDRVASLLGEGRRLFPLGRFRDAHGFAAAIPHGSRLPTGCRFAPRRGLMQLLADDQVGLMGKACQILEWDETHRFCGRCGASTVALEDETAKQCLRCGLLSYPRIAPAIIVGVRKGGRILLVRAHRHRSGLYSNVAGFVEPGETLEEAVRRELEEEVGIRVRRIRYFASQPWPFPHSLMVGFTAEHESGSIRIYEKEIADARWFSPDDLPPIPDHYTIARRLIDAVVRDITARRFPRGSEEGRLHSSPVSGSTERADAKIPPCR